MNYNSRVLLAWENGAGLGHAKRILKVAQQLQALGLEPIIAAKDIGAAQPDYRAAKIRMLQAPKHRGFVGDARKYRAQSYADIMAGCAWDDVEALHVAVHAWDTLLDIVRPALVVSDYSPILPLATLNRYPLLVFGDGFVVPPKGRATFPLLQKLDVARAEDAQLIQNGKEVLRARGDYTAQIASLCDLLNGDKSVVCTFPELDVYQQYRQTPAVGPLERQDMMPCTDNGYLFVYLAADSEHTEKAVEGALAAGVSVRAFIRDARPKQRDVWRARGVFIHDRTPDLRSELQGATAILHHGGIGTMETALAAGRPQLLLPRHLEQTLNAQRLGSLGVAVRLASPFEAKHATAAVLHVMQSKDMRNKAQDVAREIAKREGPTGLDHIVTACLEMMNERTHP